VEREFPKMLYRAEHYHGKALCMAAPPDPIEFPTGREFEHADEAARKFSEKCQREVNDEREMSRAMEDGWRESPKEAVKYLRGRERDRSTAEAHRNYEDRNMSDLAKREIAEEREARGGEHIVSMPEKRRRRGRPKGSKNKPKE
jgi:hypothetical protein